MEKERIKEAAFPFTYYGWDEAGGDYGDVQFYNVIFTEDFGPIKKGDKFSCVVVMHCKGTISCMIDLDAPDADGNTIKEVHALQFKVVPA